MRDGLKMAEEVASSLECDPESWRIVSDHFRMPRRPYGNPGQAVTVSDDGMVHHNDRTLDPGWRGRRIIRRAVKSFFRDHPMISKEVVSALHQKATRYDY